ncbi:MAG: glycine oxidase ThiO, partial [Chloroflexota bacterium]
MASRSVAQPDVVVIGGGIIGCATAYALAAAGARVTLLERDRIGSGSSGAAAGMIGYTLPLAAGDAHFTLLAAAARQFPDLAARLYDETGLDVELRRDGALRLATGQEECEPMRAQSRWAEDAGVRTEWLEPDDVHRLQPGLTPEIAGALWLPDGTHLRSPRLTLALARAAALRGADLREGVAVTGLWRQGDRLAGVRTSEGPLSPGVVVLAAGAWCGLLTADFPRPIAVSPVKGQMLATLAPHGWPRYTLIAPGVSLVPRVDGQVTIGASVERVGYGARPTLGVMAGLIQAAERLMPGIGDLPLHAAWAGLRPATPDGTPIIGPVEGWSGLLAATGHF